MGICCSKEIAKRKPGFSQLISVSSISKSTKLENIQKKFEFTRVIGYGVFGTVREATKLSCTFGQNSPKLYAIKSIVKSKVEVNLSSLQRELQILKTVDHPNIIKLYEVYEDKKYLHLVTELCTGGDLLTYLIKKVSLSEQEVVALIYKTLSAISYLHNLSICHRDIKPENILLENDSHEAEPKLVDFGMSNFVGINGLNTFAGTPYYIAPEVIQGRYSKECDIWSVGVLMYYLLSGRQPFHAVNVSSVFENILEGLYNFNKNSWNSISEEAKDLIRRMLVVEPNRRITVNEALNHSVFNKISGSSQTQEKLKVFNSLKKFSSPGKLWNEAMMIFVNNFSIQEIETLKAAFVEMDSGKTGFITAANIASAMQMNRYDIAYQDFCRIVKNIEYIGKGKLNYSQFLIAAMNRKKELDEDRLWVLFKHFDLDDNGRITMEELRYALEKAVRNATESEIEEILEEFEKKAPDSMNFEMFLEVMRCVTEEATPESDNFKGRKKSIVHHYTAIIKRSQSKEFVPSINSIT